MGTVSCHPRVITIGDNPCQHSQEPFSLSLSNWSGYESVSRGQQGRDIWGREGRAAEDDAVGVERGWENAKLEGGGGGGGSGKR